MDSKKTIELWEGRTVEVNEQLLDDFDFVSDLSSAVNNGDIPTLIEMYMALIGGEEVYAEIRSHIEETHGYFSQKELMKITEKIDAVFPKSGNRAQRRSWKTSR